MTAFWGDLRAVVAAGFALALVLVGVYCLSQGFDGPAFETFALRWLHILCGTMWIGLLWHLNAILLPGVPPADLARGVGWRVPPAGLSWMRWSATGTLVLGLVLALRAHYLVEALTLDFSEGAQGWPAVPKYLAIGIGMWLGIAMWAIVWFVLWPGLTKAQQAGGLSEARKAACLRRAAGFARLNMLLSLPMLFSMVAAGHLY